MMSGMVLGDVDRYLLGEGTHRRLWELLGAHVIDADVGAVSVADSTSSGNTGGGVRFSVWAPNARRVSVIGDWNGWDAEADVMFPQGASGVWSKDIGIAQVGNRYKYVVEGADGVTREKADPMARAAEHPPAQGSLVTGPASHIWGDGDWMRARDAGPAAQRPMRIYEVHAGSWRRNPDGTVLGYRQLGEQLADYCTMLGFTHVELLPLAEHPFGGSWGYQVSGYYAPTARYGAPDDLRAMVDTLHRAGIGVLLDWVPAHFPKDDWSLGRFDGTALYEHADPRQGEHPDWGTYVFNYGRNEVRNFLIANALYWFEEFHVDGLRVDAVASMLYLDYSRQHGEWVPNKHGGRENLDAVEFLGELNSAVFAAHPGVAMIAEESTAWPKVSHPVDHGGLGFSHKWNMGWMHDTLGYFSHDPVHRQWHHRELTFGLMYAFTERFVLPLSHDEVVHGKGSLLNKQAGPAHDEHAWQKFANLRAVYGWMWAYPGAPLVFMGAELAPFTEWNDGAPLPWHLLDHAPHAGVQRLVGALNAAVAARPALWEQDGEPSGFQWLEADDAQHSILAFLRWSRAGDAVACIANLTPVPRPGYRVGLPLEGAWEPVLDTDSWLFGGSGFAGDRQAVEATGDIAWQRQSYSAVIDLPPLAVVWLARSRS